jgi:hypothetical protein
MKLSPEKKMTETLHHALRAMMQFPVIFFSGDTPSPNKKMNSFLKSLNMSQTDVAPWLLVGLCIPCASIIQFDFVITVVSMLMTV